MKIKLAKPWMIDKLKEVNIADERGLVLYTAVQFNVQPVTGKQVAGEVIKNVFSIFTLGVMSYQNSEWIPALISISKDKVWIVKRNFKKKTPASEVASNSFTIDREEVSSYEMVKWTMGMYILKIAFVDGSQMEVIASKKELEFYDANIIPLLKK